MVLNSPTTRGFNHTKYCDNKIELTKLDEQYAIEIIHMNDERSPKQRGKEFKRWRGEKQRRGYLMSGRGRIAEFLAHACKTAATLAGHCGFVLQLHCSVLCWLKCWQKIKTVLSQYCPEVLIWNHILQQCTGTKLAQFGDLSFCHFAQRMLLKCAPAYLAPQDVKGCGTNQTETHFKADFMQTLTLEINVSPSAKVLMKFREGAAPPS